MKKNERVATVPPLLPKDQFQGFTVKFHFSLIRISKLPCLAMHSVGEAVGNKKKNKRPGENIYYVGHKIITHLDK